MEIKEDREPRWTGHIIPYCLKPAQVTDWHYENVCVFLIQPPPPPPYNQNMEPYMFPILITLIQTKAVSIEINHKFHLDK